MRSANANVFNAKNEPTIHAFGRQAARRSAQRAATEFVGCEQTRMLWRRRIGGNAESSVGRREVGKSGKKDAERKEDEKAEQRTERGRCGRDRRRACATTPFAFSLDGVRSFFIDRLHCRSCASQLQARCVRPSLLIAAITESQQLASFVERRLAPPAVTRSPVRARLSCPFIRASSRLRAKNMC
jgi:hypothetical protein